MDDDLSGRFEITVDPDAEPVDIDEVLAEFLLSCVRKDGGSADERPDGPDTFGTR